jgi:transcriptional antiterminator RfaH
MARFERACAMSNPSSLAREDGAWWAIQTKPRQEARADANLQTSGVHTFLPLVRHVSPGRSKRGWIVTVEPLFPRYLFARCDVPGMAHRIRFARGVSKILGIGDCPTPVDDSIIAVIQRRVGEDGCVRLAPALKPGDRIRIVAGPLRDFVGVFESSIAGADRVRLLLAALHGQWRVVVDDALVEATSQAPAFAAETIDA